MDYFKDCECQETAKEKYRSLAKKLHPDKGGTKEEMAELTKQYDKFKKYGPSKTHSETIFEEMQRQYTQARKSYDDAFTGGSTRFRRFDPEPEPKARPNGQTAGWRTNKPHTTHEGYGDIPFDHPIRQELFNLRNRLASCDNTYRKPRAPDYDDKLRDVEVELKRLQNTHLTMAARNLELEEKNTFNEFQLNNRQRDLNEANEKIRSLESKLKTQQLKFKNMRFFAKICYLFLPD